MKRWQYVLNPPDSSFQGYVLETIQKLRHRFPLLAPMSNNEIYVLYSAYSDHWCAGWLVDDNDTLDRFYEWCIQDYGAGDAT